MQQRLMVGSGIILGLVVSLVVALTVSQPRLLPAQVSGAVPGPGSTQASGTSGIKKFEYQIVEVTTDTATMQRTLNEYGAAGWELISVGLGDMTAPRMIFKR